MPLRANSSATAAATETERAGHARRNGGHGAAPAAMTHVARSDAVERRNRGAAAAPRWRGRHYLLMGELSQPIRVLVVDDHRVVREGLRSYLGLVDDIEMVGEASDGRAALDWLARAKAEGELPDVVLMDLMMEPMDGIAATAAIKERYPAVEVVAVTSFVEEEKVHSALEAGAAGYLLKDAEADEVAAAVRSAQRGEVHLDPAVARKLTASLRRGPSASPKDLLTEREIEILLLVAQGKANKEIAAGAGDQRADRADAREQHSLQAGSNLAHAGCAVGGARGTGAAASLSYVGCRGGWGHSPDARPARRRLTGWMHANGLIRVLVIESDARVRRALEQLIDAEEGMEVVAAAASARDVRVADGRAAADVVLLDLLMPSVGAGLGLVGDLAGAGYAVVATSLAGSARAAAMEAGATCFIEKGPDPAALLAAIRHSAEPARCE